MSDSGVIPSPNIWNTPHLYELENLAVDPDGVIENAMRQVQGWAGATVLDIGCGTGFHLPFFAREARTVIGVEPHPRLVEAARRRVSGAATGTGATRDAIMSMRTTPGAATPPATPPAAPASATPPATPASATPPATPASATPPATPPAVSASAIEVRHGTAQDIPVPDASIDVAHARWAYFFGPGCEPGLVELGRVMRRGGVAFVIDNDASRSTFGRWFREFLPRYDPAVVERFWARQGWTRVPLTMRWQFTTREDFASVLGIEFPAALAAKALAEQPGLEVDYAINVFWRRF